LLFPQTIAKKINFGLETLQRYLPRFSNSENAQMSLVGLEYRLHCILNE